MHEALERIKVIEKIRENQDRYTWKELNCFYKPVAILYRSLEESYFDYFLFYTCYYSSFMADGYYTGLNKTIELFFSHFFRFHNDFIADKLGYRIHQIEFSDERVFHEKIIEQIASETRLLFPADLFHLYYYPDYKKRHEQHYFIVKGYDVERELYSILDNQHLENGRSIIYKDFAMNFSTLYRLCCDYFLHIWPKEKKFFWAFQPVKERDPLKESDILFDHCRHLKETKSAPERVKCIESEIVQALCHKRISYDELEPLLAQANSKPVYYDILFKLLLPCGMNEEGIKELFLMKENLLDLWNNVKNNIIYEVMRRSYDFRQMIPVIEEGIRWEKSFREKFVEIVEEFSRLSEKEREERYAEGRKAGQEYTEPIAPGKQKREKQGRSEKTVYREAETETERKLVAIWKEVLGIDRIGVLDNFFELGGHSIKAVAMIIRIQKEFRVDIPLKTIFELETIQKLAHYLIEAEISLSTPLEPLGPREYYPLSSAQRRLFLIHQIASDTTSYNIPFVMRIKGKIVRDALEAALAAQIARHESLRTTFELIDGEPVQKIHPSLEVPITYFQAQEKEADGIIRSFVRPFLLDRLPLFRTGLIEVREEEHIFLFDVHHIVADGTSISILFEELGRLYQGYSLPPLRIQYKEFSEWKNRLIGSESLKKQEAYWLKEFEGEVPILQVPTDRMRPSVQNFAGQTIHFSIDCEVTEELKELTVKTETTLYMIFLAAYTILLSRYSGQEDIVVGTPIAGRTHPDVEHVVGMFVNTLAIRNYPKGEKLFTRFLAEVKEKVLDSYENQEYPFEELVDRFQIERDLSRNPLFDAVFVMLNMGALKIEIPHLDITPYPFPIEATKFDLTFYAEERDEGMKLSVEYSTALYERETIERMVDHLIQILKEVIHNPYRKISEIQMTDEKEREKILSHFNDTKRDYPADRTIHRLFEQEVKKNNHHRAVVFQEGAFSYKELNEKSTRLAGELQERGVREESIVGILLERSAEFIVSILGTLKAGGAYLPIDPEYPKERIRYMLNDSQASVIISKPELFHKLPQERTLLNIEEIHSWQKRKRLLPFSSHPGSLAYVMYTSGSTGNPKGVMVEHRNVVRLVKNSNYIQFAEDDRILLTGAVVFDATTFEIWGALLNGLELHIVEKSLILNPDHLEEVIQKNKITILWLTSPLFNQLSLQNDALFSGLRYLLVGGDVLSPAHIDRVRKRNRSLTVINGYGPTENTTFSTCFTIDKDERSSIPIGKPIANSNAIIIDPYGNLQPVGVQGELCVGGDGLSRGYLGKPELTEEKFVPNPSFPGEKMYRTGDRARWLADGTIEFLGRIDSQVKIRGFRIEPGEIENQLLSHREIDDCVVIACEDKQKSRYLCAYFVARRNLPPSLLRDSLSLRVPDYMVPSYFVQLDQLPLTVNGKVNLKRLPLPETQALVHSKRKGAKTEAEKKVAAIWKEVLEVGEIGVTDNFFEVGGHSLKATILVEKLKKECNIELPLVDFFKAPTIRDTARFMDRSKNRRDTIENIVLLKRGADSRKRLFLVHDGTGGIEGYLEFCKNISSEFDCFGIKVHPEIGHVPKVIRVEEIARMYVERIKERACQEPYFIAGWSLGGTIAFEMTRQLENDDREIGACALIDSPPPDERLSADAIPFDIRSEDNLMGQFIKSRSLKKRLKEMDELDRFWNCIIAHLRPDSFDRQGFKQKIDPDWLDIIPDFDRMSLKDLFSSFNIIRTLSNARAVYLPDQRLRAPVSFFKAADSDIPNLNQWKNLCENLSVYTVQGDHYSIFREPQVEDFVQLFNKILDESSH